MDKKSKIYVAGHRGLVGSAILRVLQGKGYKNIAYRQSRELDLRNQEDAENFFRDERPEYVFLAAAKVGGILANSTYKAEFIYDNIMISANVVHSSYKYGVKKLLNLGSACIYPKHAPQPMKEEYLLTGALEPTNEPYAIAKIAAIKLCRYYNEQYGTNFISVMPANLYGPNDNFNLETSHALAAFIRKFYLAKFLQEKKYAEIEKDILKYRLGFKLDDGIKLGDYESTKKALEKIGITRDKVFLWGSGEPFREFLYADDLGSACVFIMQNCDRDDMGEVINIGCGEDLKIKELAEMVKGIVGFKGDIVWDNSKPDGIDKKLLDISRITRMGWRPQISLKQGIKKSYHWAIGRF